MARGKTLQTSVPGFGRIYQPSYRDKKTGELKHSAVWWVEYGTSDGKVWRSLRTKDQAAAYNELLRLVGRKAAGEITETAPERVTFADLFSLLIEDYQTRELATAVDIEERVRVHIGPAFGHIRVIDLRKADVEKFKRNMLAKEYAPGTINRCLSAIRRALQIGADEDPPLVVRAIPRWFSKLDESEGVRSGVVTAEMYQALLPAFVAPHARLAFVIGYHTGLRRGAILGLRWEWVDWRQMVIRIPTGRQSTKLKPRIVPIYGDMRGFMEMARTSSPPGCAWVVNEGGKRVESIKTAWGAAFERAGLTVDTGRKRKDGEPLIKPAALFHDLRRTAATMLHEAGFDLPTIMDICGWRSPAMPKRYIQQSVKQAQGVGERMARFIQQQMDQAQPGARKQ